MSSEQLDLFDQPIPPVVERLTFNQLMRLFKRAHWDRKKEAARQTALCNYMVEFFDGRPIEAIGRQDTINLITWLRTKKNLGAWMLIKARGIMRLMFNLAEIWREDGFVEGHDVHALALPRKNPTFKVPAIRAPKPQLFLFPFEFRGYIRAARKVGDWGFEAAFKMGLWFRLSPIDLENLNDDEIDEQAFEIRVHRRHTITDINPTGCLQVIKLTEKAWALIDRCRRARRPGEKLILPIQLNKRRRFAKIRKAAVAAGFRDMTLSALRRAATDYLLEKGYSKETVADAAGHTTTKMLDPHYSRKKHAPHRYAVTNELVESFSG